jgi:hypothetical protein
MLVDEIDKAGGSERSGDIRQTLLPMLEPETARAWFDEALLTPADLSQISWIMTANDAARLSSPLLSRVALMPAPPPSPDMFDALLAGLLRSVADDLGVAMRKLPRLTSGARELLQQTFRERPDLRLIKRARSCAVRRQPDV